MSSTLKPRPPLAYKPAPRKPLINGARVLLFLLIFSIAVTPRFRLSGDVSADIRLQDLLLIPAALYLLLSPRSNVRTPLLRLFGNRLLFFFWGSIVAASVAVFFAQGIPITRRILFYGRGIEIFILAMVVAGLYLRSGKKPMKNVLRAIHLGAWINLGWVAYQLSTGVTETLFGSEIGNEIDAYGPKLIGEGSAFATGQYFAFIAAVAAAEIKVRRRKFGSLVLFAAAFTGAYLSESRISIGSILVITALLLVLSKARGRLLNIGGTLAGIAVAGFGVALMLPTLDDRLSAEAIQGGLMFRVDRVWAPLVELLGNNMIFGIGPGGLVGDLPVEAHNFVLRALLDYGVPVGIVFITLFTVTMKKAFRLAKSPLAGQATRVAAYMAGFATVSVIVSGMVQDSLTGVMSSHLTMVSIGVFAAALGAHRRDLARAKNARLAGSLDESEGQAPQPETRCASRQQRPELAEYDPPLLSSTRTH